MNSFFEPALWPQEDLPNEAEEYAQCAICTPKSPVIWGEGNKKAPIAVILDNPGARKDKEGFEYICATRQTLQKALFLSGFSPDNFYLTYLLKCRPLRKYNKEEIRAFSKPFLVRQIGAMRPRFIVLLGDVVVQAMFDDKDAHVKNLRGVWHTVLGRRCVVSYHPLAIRRRPNLMSRFMADLGLLRDEFANY